MFAVSTSCIQTQDPESSKESTFWSGPEGDAPAWLTSASSSAALRLAKKSRYTDTQIAAFCKKADDARYETLLSAYLRVAKEVQRLRAASKKLIASGKQQLPVAQNSRSGGGAGACARGARRAQQSDTKRGST